MIQTEYSDNIGFLAFVSDGHLIVNVPDYGIMLWDFSAGRPRRILPGTDFSSSICLSPDKKIITNNDFRELNLCDVYTGKALRVFSGYTETPDSFVFSPDGQIVASGDRDGVIKLLNVQTGRELRTLTGDSAISTLAFSPDGQSVASGSEDGTITLWNVQTGKALYTFREDAKIVVVTFSPDGHILLTGSRADMMKAWDVRTGKELYRFPWYGGYAKSIAFSPEGQVIASGSIGETAELWDAKTGKKLHTLTGHSGYVKSVAFSPNGQILATGGGSDNTVRLWDVQTGEALNTFTGHTREVNILAFRSDGQIVASGSRDGTVKLWDVKNQKAIATLISTGDNDWIVTTSEGQFDASPRAMQFVQWSGEPETLERNQLKERYYEPDLLPKLLGFEDKLYPAIEFSDTEPTDSVIRVHLTNRGGGIGKVVVFLNGQEAIADARLKNSDPQGQEMNLMFDLSNHPLLLPDKRNIVEVEAYNAEGSLGSSKIWRSYEVETQRAVVREPEHVSQTGGHTWEINAVAFSPDGNIVASSSRMGEKTILWDVRTGKELNTLPGGVRSLIFSPDGHIIAIGNTLWEVSTGRELHTPGLEGKVEAFSPDNRIVADDRTLWDVHTGEQLHTFSGRGSILAFSPDWQIAATMIDDTITFWDIQTDVVLHTIECGYTGIFSPDGQFFASRCHENTIILWDVHTGQKLHTLSEPPDANVSSLVFSPDGQILANITRERRQPPTITLWDVHAGKKSRTFSEVPDEISSLTFSPDGQILAGSVEANVTDGPLVLWDVSTGKVRHTFNEYAFAPVFSPDGQIIAYAGTGTIRDVRTGTPVRAFKKSTQAGFQAPIVVRPIVSATTFDPDGFIVVSTGNTVTLWDLRTGRKRRLLPKEAEKFSVFFYSPIMANRLSFNTLTLYISQGELEGSEQNPPELWNILTHKGVYSDFLKCLDIRLNSTLFEIKHSPQARFRCLLAFNSGAQILASNTVFSGSTGNTVILWDAQTGKELHKLTGHTDFVDFFLFSPDGTMLATHSWDNTVKLWDVRTGRELLSFTRDSAPKSSRSLPPGYIHETDLALGTLISNPIAFSPDGKILAGLMWKRIALWDVHTGEEVGVLPNSGAPLAFRSDGKMLIAGDTFWDISSGEEIATFSPISQGIGIIGWGDYMLTTPDKYYIASKGALKDMTFRVGTRTYPFEQFDLKFNRPDIVLQRLGYTPQTLIDAYYTAYQKRLKKMRFTEEQLGDDFHLPEIEILDKDLVFSTTEKTLTFKIKATDSKYLLDRLNVFVNDVPVYGMDGINLREQNAAEHEQEITLELSNGRNKIQISALNQQGVESLKDTLEISYDGTLAPSELYVVAVGVSTYADEDYNLRYAAKDATDLVAFFQAHREHFDTVKIQTILDADATKEQILEIKDWLHQTQVDDHVILFFAGHGLLDEQLDYYFATTDIDFDHPAGRGLPYDAIEDLLDGIPARRKILLMDTCHSGEVDKEDVQVVAATETPVADEAVNSRSFRGMKRLRESTVGLRNSFELLQELFANLQRGSGAMVISSASGLEFAYESGRYRNGLFTYALLEGLQGQADANGDQEIRVSELRDYVTEKVQEMTNDRQTPTARRESVEFDFRVY